MFQYRQVLVRLRAGDTVREIARSGLMGRDKLGELRSVAQQHGWLDAACAVCSVLRNPRHSRAL